MKSVLYLVAISILPTASVLNAQTPTPDVGGFNQFDRMPIQQSIQQPRGFSNPNSGSRQFFQQGRDNLYFLEESEPILQIEQESESEKEVEGGKIQEQKGTSEPEE